MRCVDVNGIALCTDSFGNDEAPLVLLVGGTTMLSWPDARRVHPGARPATHAPL